MTVTVWPRQISTSGGSRESEVKELTVRPWGAPRESVTVAMATPVGKLPQACRNSSLVTLAG
jgi:hypothetical protein